MKVTGMFFAIVNLLWIVNAVVASAEDKSLSSHIQVTKYAPKSDSFPGCTHIAFSGRLYVIGSSVGAVVEVVDFGKQQYRIHNSFEKKKDAPAGSWKSTGLVLNDVDFFNGHWYATSYFCPTYAGNQNYDENKFIRFRTWQDLKEGTWDDLSHFLPSKVVPYYLMPREDAIFIAVFNHEEPGTFGKVYRLTISE